MFVAIGLGEIRIITDFFNVLFFNYFSPFLQLGRLYNGFTGTRLTFQQFHCSWSIPWKVSIIKKKTITQICLNVFAYSLVPALLFETI